MSRLISIDITTNHLLTSVLFVFVICSLWTVSASVQATSVDPDDISAVEKGELLQLRQALLKYMAIASRGGWPSISGETPLKEGEQGERFSLLRERPLITGDIDGRTTGNENMFDEAFRTVVMRFQKRHGLKEDGVVGAEALRFLNLPVDERIRKININMERLGQIPDDVSKRFLRVNIAGFELVAA